jgi:phospholipid/cholesterol/gamma-HCH transport system substrate-binding protein
MDTKDNKRAIIVGLFLALGLVVFLVGIFFLGGQQKTFSKSIHISSVFDDVQGLKQGNNVWFSGVKIGTISSMAFVGAAQVNVVMRIDADKQQFIHRNATARISSDGLIGNKIIVLDSGSPQAPAVQNGDELQAAKLVSTDDIIKTLQQSNQNILSVTGDFKLLSRKILQGKGTVGTLLADSLMGVQLRASMSNLAATTAAAARMSAQLESFTKKVNTKGGLADNLFTDTVTFNKAKAAVAQLQQAATSAKEFADNLNQASNKLKSSDNVIGVMLNDPKSAAQLKSTMDNLQKGSVLLNEDLKAAQSNFLLKGFFKDQAKAKADSIKKANKK